MAGMKMFRCNNDCAYSRRQPEITSDRCKVNEHSIENKIYTQTEKKICWKELSGIPQDSWALHRGSLDV